MTGPTITGGLGGRGAGRASERSPSLVSIYRVRVGSQNTSLAFEYMNTMNEQRPLFNLFRVYRSYSSFYTNPFKHLERLNIVRSIDTLSVALITSIGSDL